MDNSRVTLVVHPMVQHKLSILRDKATSCKQFRELVRELALFEGYEATRDLPLSDVDVATPICTARCKQVSGKKLAVVPILRAGLGMVDGVLDLIPAARVGHLGMYRNEETHEPVPYYDKMPEDIANRTVLVVDPMLATGGSACDAITRIKQTGCTHITMMCLVAAPEGIKKLAEEHPDVDVYSAALDERLNEHAYIVPGLGDAGDRIFHKK